MANGNGFPSRKRDITRGYGFLDHQIRSAWGFLNQAHGHSKDQLIDPALTRQLAYVLDEIDRALDLIEHHSGAHSRRHLKCHGSTSTTGSAEAETEAAAEAPATVGETIAPQ